MGEQVAEDFADRPQALELVEDDADDGANLLVGIEVIAAIRRMYVSDRRIEEDLTSEDLVQESLPHPPTKEVKLGLRHDPVGTWNIIHKFPISGHPGGDRSFASSGIDAGLEPSSGRCVMASGKEMSHGSFSNSSRANGSLSPPPGRISRARLSP